MAKRAGKKAAIELSMNFLVMIIISLVILAGGIALLYKFIGGAEDIKSQLDQRTSEELERLLVGQGKKVALPLHVADVARGETHVFGLGIMNLMESSEDFYVKAEIDTVVDEVNKDITASMDKTKINQWVLYNTEAIKIEPGNYDKETLLVNVPKDAVKGQYIFSAKVYTSTKTLYGNPQKFFVNVK